MTASVFVDTNILLYAADAREPAKQAQAQAWIDHLWVERSGRTSMQVISEFYFNVKRAGRGVIDAGEAWDIAASYLAWSPQVIDAALMRKAREIEGRWRLSWWDSLVVAAAQFQDCTLLLTEDLQDGAVFGGVTVRSPFKLDLHEPEATYAVTPATRARHRSRGRPARVPG